MPHCGTQCEGQDLNPWTTGRRSGSLRSPTATSLPPLVSLAETLQERSVNPRRYRIKSNEGLRGQDAPSCPHFSCRTMRHAVRGTGFEPVDHGKTIRLASLADCDFPASARFTRGDSTGAERESASLPDQVKRRIARARRSILPALFVPHDAARSARDRI